MALVSALCPPPYGKMSYAATGAVAVMWNAEPMPVPCVAASLVVNAGVTPAGQSRLRPGPAFAVGMPLRKRMATAPAGIAPPARGAYWMFWPVPVGMYANVEGSRACRRSRR